MADVMPSGRFCQSSLSCVQSEQHIGPQQMINVDTGPRCVLELEVQAELSIVLLLHEVFDGV